MAGNANRQASAVTMPHGNSKENQDDHHLYGINDREYDDVFKYGICGDPLLPDGSSPRANLQTRQFNNITGWPRFYPDVLETEIPGREEALKREREYIEAYREKNGRMPRGNLK